MSNWMAMLDKAMTAVDQNANPFIEGINSPAPSVNFIFGNTHLIPFGASCIFWGPPKGGKSLLCNMMIGQLHKQYPDAIAIKFNTEMREKFQMTRRSFEIFGIDPDRYRAYDTNRPEDIFDFIEKTVAELCEKGAPVRLVVIDSITDVLGRRTLNADSVNTQQIGDDAATQKDGLKRIKSVLRRFNITLLMVAQERSELDPLEQMRGKKTKMAGAFYLKHFAEYFVYVAPNESKEGKQTILGEKFEVESLTDMMGNADTVAHKIRVQMKDSSVGVAKRVGEFTWHKYKGVINIHEEAFRLGIARNILERPNNRTYILKNWPVQGEECKWDSRENCFDGLKNNEDACNEVIKRVRLKDIELFKNGQTDEDFNAAEPIADEESSD